MTSALSGLGGNKPIKKASRKSTKNTTDNAAYFRKAARETKRQYVGVFKQLEKVGKGRSVGILKNLDVRSRKPGARNFIPKDFKKMTDWEKGKYIVEKLYPASKSGGSERTAIYVTKAAIVSWKDNKKLVEDIYKLQESNKKSIGKLSSDKYAEHLKTKTKLQAAILKGTQKREKELLKRSQQLNIWSDVVNNSKIFVSKTDEIAAVWEETRILATGAPGDIKKTFNELAKVRKIFND